MDSGWTTNQGFGGGSVAGDIQELKVILKEDAILLLRTQGSTKIFKSVDGKYCSQRVSVNLASGSLFAFLPDPTTCFKDSRYCQYQIYYMHEAASLVLVDWYTSGRMSRGENWLLDRLRTKLEVFIAGKRVILDSLDLHDTPGISSAADKVANASVFGSIVLIGPRTEEIRARVGTIMYRQTYRQKRESNNGFERNHQEIADVKMKLVLPNEPLVSVSNLADGVTVLRFAADSTEDAYKLLAEILKPLATGSLQDMPKPYADRIHCLPGRDFLAAESILEKNGGIDNNIDNSLLQTRKRLGSVMTALAKYDDTALTAAINESKSENKRQCIAADSSD